MSVRRDSPAPRPAPVPPELEDEVDLGRYWASVAARWWLPLAGLVLGAVVGFLVAVVGGATGTKGVPNTLFAITVKAPSPAKAARAANELARIVVQTISDQYVNPKIATLNAQVKADEQELASLDKRLGQEQALLGSLSGAEKLAAIGIIGIAEQRRSVVTQDLLSTRPHPDARRRHEDDRPQQAQLRCRGRLPRAPARRRRRAPLGAPRGPARPP